MSTGATDIIGLYRRHALAWAADRGTALREQAWLDRFVAPLPHNPSILDLGCGSGDPIARYLIGRGCRLTGVDSSPEMIALCAGKFPDHDWRVGDMRGLAPGPAFDGVVAWDSFFHLSHADQRGMFPLFRALVRPGGTLMYTSGTSHGVAMGTCNGEPLYHASLDPAEYRALLVASGFAVREHVVQDPSCDRTVWLSQRA